MTDWGLAVKVFVSGVSIVMIIMFLLQLSVSASSFVVRYFDQRLAKAKE